MINWGTVPLGSLLLFPFPSYDGATGASEAISGLAVTDIEVFKGTTNVQRASDNGYTLIDTDGIDIDGIVGANGFAIDTSDNTDAGFYTAGTAYYVWVASVTADGQTVNVLAGTFRLSEPHAVFVGPMLRKYNTLLVTGTTSIPLPITKLGGGWAGSGDWTPSTNGGGAGASDVLVSVDGATLTNATNLPTFNNGWQLILTGAELTGKIIRVVIRDTAAKAIADVQVIIETFGHSSAMYVDDFNASSGVPQTQDHTAILDVIESQTDDIGTAGAGLTALGDTRLANLNATISSRASQTSVDDLPTNAELATALAAADDAVLAAIAGLNNPSAASIVAALKAESFGGRTYNQLISALAMRHTISADGLTYTIMDNDGNTLWTRTFTRAAFQAVRNST